MCHLRDTFCKNIIRLMIFARARLMYTGSKYLITNATAVLPW